MKKFFNICGFLDFLENLSESPINERRYKIDILSQDLIHSTFFLKTITELEDSIAAMIEDIDDIKNSKIHYSCSFDHELKLSLQLSVLLAYRHLNFLGVFKFSVSSQTLYSILL